MTDWLERHRHHAPYTREDGRPAISWDGHTRSETARDVAFNRHSMNDGSHVSPFDNGKVQIAASGIQVRLLQGVDEESLRRVLSRATRATTGLPVPEPWSGRDDYMDDADEMFRGGLQAALESQTIVFEVWGASRALTHQLVRSRRAGFHQQSQRATWYGDRPEVRMPLSIWEAPAEVRMAWMDSYAAAWKAYKLACDADVSYQDARYILPEATTNYIMCEYTIREFIAVYAYRACSMFLWEMWVTMRMMRTALIGRHPFLEPYVKISCEKGADCQECGGSGHFFSNGAPATKTEVDRLQNDLEVMGVEDLIECTACSGIGSSRRCTFQGWESVEGQCGFPWARQSNRVFLPDPKYRIGASS